MMISIAQSSICWLALTLVNISTAFSPVINHDIKSKRKNHYFDKPLGNYLTSTSIFAEGGSSNGKSVDEYKNIATSFLSNFMKKNDNQDTIISDPLSNIDFNAPKFSQKVSISKLASILDSELYEKEWFVTGRVNPIYFSDKFEFQDPDVKLKGIEAYARGVNKLFDQETSRAEIISTVVSETIPDTITVTWRLSGKVNIGPGLTIKPYICYTDLKVDTGGSGLIIFQEDRFDIPQWDILLSALFPFLIGKVTSEPAPPVSPRVVESAVSTSQVGKFPDVFSFFGKTFGKS